MPPILGYYSWVWAGGLEPRTTKSPYYGLRVVWLEAVRRWSCQILVPVLGELMWVNQ